MSLQFERADDIDRHNGAPDNFTGTAYFQPVATNEACQLRAARVTFEKGAHILAHPQWRASALFPQGAWARAGAR
ncbi:MAG: hypothetical protein ABI670_13065 [Chloroflexota bacterium]